MAMSRGQVKVIDPEAWAIVDGKLYLSFSERGIRKFGQNPADNIKNAEAAWDKGRQ